MLGENIKITKTTKRKQKETETQNIKTRRKTKKEIQDIQPTNLCEYFVRFIRGGSWAGYPVVLLLC